MTINRNNYEEYFLLYIDRELADGERQMVEDFVRRHPDLEKELAALKQPLSFRRIWYLNIKRRCSGMKKNGGCFRCIYGVLQQHSSSYWPAAGF